MNSITKDDYWGLNLERCKMESFKDKRNCCSSNSNVSADSNWFIYELCNASNEIVKKSNSILNKFPIYNSIRNLLREDIKFKFHGIENKIFNNNLVLIDSKMPQILAEMVKLFYSSNISRVSDLVHEIRKMNPANYDLTDNHKFYEYKIKHFLTDIAVGMMPGSVWDGKYDSTGGYLIVKESGDIIAYHLYNKNEFENYLFHNTKFDTPSSSRHDFGYIYTENNKYFIKLNFQIRFVK